MDVWQRRTLAGCALVMSLWLAPAHHARAAEVSTQPIIMHMVSTAEWATLFDPSTHLAQRHRMLDALEQNAGSANGDDLYLLGSLYHMEPHSPDSPVQADTDKAAMYFANAAVRGNVLAMAKMAEVKYGAGEYREVMN